MHARRNGPNKDDKRKQIVCIYASEKKIQKMIKEITGSACVPSLASSVCGAELEEHSLLEGSELVV